MTSLVFEMGLVRVAAESRSVAAAELCLFFYHTMDNGALVRLALLGFTFFVFYLSPDFHELWRWDTLVLGWVTASMHYYVSDGFAAQASRLKHFLALFLFILKVWSG